MTDQPWYKDGLQFSCTGCGNCCTGPSGFVWITEEELQAIAEFRQQSVGEFRIFHTRLFAGRTSLTEFANGDCTFFDPATRRCSIYPVRPVQCRTWPFWRRNLRTKDDWQRVESVCPGAGVGQFVSLEEIEAQASQLEL